MLIPFFGAGGGLPAVHFDGTNDWLSKASVWSGSSDSKALTISFWIKRASTGTSDLLFFRTSGGEDIFNFGIYSSNKLHFEAREIGSAIIVSFEVDSPLLSSTTDWQHILISFDLTNASNRFIYINDSAATVTWDIYRNVSMLFSQMVPEVCGNTGASTLYDGDMAELYINYGTYIDISNSTNRRKFITALGKPAGLGANGTIPTGSQPIAYFTGYVQDWHTNKGSGGGMTENGILTVATTSPDE